MKPVQKYMGCRGCLKWMKYNIMIGFGIICSGILNKEAEFVVYVLVIVLYGPRREKTCLWSFRQSENQTSLISYRD